MLYNIVTRKRGGVGMSKFSLAYRKLYLQYLQTKHVAKGKNKDRTKEQRKVFRYLLINPKQLLTSERVPQDNKYAKSLNVLTVNSKNDRLYNLTKKSLSNV